MLLFIPAFHVRQALNLCNPNRSIKDDFGRLYVDRGDRSDIAKIKKHLLYEMNYPKILFTGTKGSGKSTELIRLSEDKKLKKRFHIKMISGKDTGADILKILTTIIKKLKEITDSEKLKDTSSEIDGFLSFIAGWKTRVELSGPIIDERLNKALAGANVGEDKNIKYIQKKDSAPGVGDFIQLINKTTEKIYFKRKFFKKEVLILFTDLEKLNEEDTIKVFLDSASALNGIQCFVVFTFPIELTYHKNFVAIKRNYSELYYLSNFGPYDPKRLDDSEEIDKQQIMLTNRVSAGLFESPEIIQRIVLLSGGIPVEMFNIVRHCCLYISNEKSLLEIWLRIGSKISEEVLNRYIDSVIKSYKKTITDSKKDTLKYIYKHHDYSKKDDDDFKSLVNQNLIIQYIEDGNVRFDVNPLLKSFIRGALEKKDVVSEAIDEE